MYMYNEYKFYTGTVQLRRLQIKLSEEANFILIILILLSNIAYFHNFNGKINFSVYYDLQDVSFSLGNFSFDVTAFSFTVIL
jgi:hypothetical protein